MVNIISKQHNAKITIFEESLPSLCNKLSAHEIDLILANDKPITENNQYRVHAKLIGEMKVILVAHPDKMRLNTTFLIL